MTATDVNKRLVRRYFEEIDRGNLGVIDELVAEDYVDHNPPPVPGIPPGREGLKHALTVFWRGMSARHHIEEQIAEGDKVVTRITNYGRHTGDLPGAPRTDNELKNGSIVIHRIANGKIVEKWAQRDMLSLYQQLGVFGRKRERAAAVSGCFGLRAIMERLSLTRSTRDASADPPAAFPPLGHDLNVLMVWPSFPPSYWSGGGMMEILPERAFLPPLGLITVAALCPKSWTIRLVDRAAGELADADLLWADLVMVSAMNVQREDAHRILRRAAALGRRTIIGGPYASAEPESLLDVADHIVVGEPDEVFGEIAADLEAGATRRVYRIAEKPDVTRTPIPRFDLLDFDNYSCLSVQFSRGCPFQCEFCDIITIYGRRPRTKSAAQLMAELDALVALGWRKSVFLVDDNFIGNHKLALGLTTELEAWQERNRFPLMFFTEASMDLALRTDLLDSMVRANFFYVFMGVETPSAESLKETKKFQNLRLEPLECIRVIQRHGLWITAGFIVGFDSDGSDIFDRQIEFIERGAIPWAMTGVLKAPTTTALHARMKAEGRLIEDGPALDISSLPNFHTVMPLPELLAGLRRMLTELYEPTRFYERARRSLDAWQSHQRHTPPHLPWRYLVGVVCRSVWKQGIRSEYRAAYWRFLAHVMVRWGWNPAKRYLGLMMLVSGHHFPAYARYVVRTLAEPPADRGTPLPNALTATGSLGSTATV